MAKVAILGFGTVGSGVYEVLTKNFSIISSRAGQPVEPSHIVDIRSFPGHPAEKLFTNNFDDILNDDEVKVVAEVIGGKTVAYEFTKKALMHKKHVVTSNKELVAAHGAELLALASENGVKYLFEASVGGGIPVIHPIKNCLAANEITEIFGILNGTTNYILTRMIKNDLTFDLALKEAQSLGYAEADPSADVDGIDASRKIAILAALAFNKQINADNIYTEGIRNLTLTDVKFAEMCGYVIKLIGYTKNFDGEIFARVSPMLVSKDSPLAVANDVFNAVLVRGNAVDDVMFYGRGAGKLPTASAVVSDIIEAVVSDTLNSKWEKTTTSKNIKETEISMLVITDEKYEKTISDVYGDVKIVGKIGSRLAFITPVLTEENLENKAKIINAEKCIRILK